MHTDDTILDAEFHDGPATPMPPRRRRRPRWRDRSLAVLVGVFVVAFALATYSIYRMFAEVQRSADATVVNSLERSSGAEAEQAHTVNDHTVAIPNCGPDQAFSAFPQREMVMRTVHVFDCGSTRYILMPPVEGR